VLEDPSLVLIALFIAIAYTIRAVVEARARTKLLQSNPTESLVHSILRREERARRHTSLRWGIVVTCLAAGFMVVELMNWEEVSPGVIAVLLGATGLGNILSYFVCRRLEERDDPV
jgi:uncharacterized membrane protein YedE/YeeE